MEVIELRLKGLKLIKPKVFKDQRGYFLESFQQALYEDAGMAGSFLKTITPIRKKAV